MREDEDLATTIAANWQKLLGGLAVILLAVWLIGEYRTAERRKAEEASQRFDTLQDAFSQRLAAGSAAKPEAAVDDTLRQNAALLQEKSEGSIYGTLAPLYEIQDAIRRGEFERAHEGLGRFSTARFLSGQGAAPDRTQELRNKDFADELASMVSLRLLVAEGKTPRAEIRESIVNLSERGQFTPPEALLLLFRLAETPEEIEQAAQQAKKVIAQRPDLAETIRVQLERAGHRVDGEAAPIA